MSCSPCTTGSLRIFLRAIVGLDVPIANQPRLLTATYYHRRCFQFSRPLGLEQSCPTLDTSSTSSFASLTSLVDTFVPFEGSGVGPRTYRQSGYQASSQDPFSAASPVLKSYHSTKTTLKANTHNQLFVREEDPEPRNQFLNLKRDCPSVRKGDAAPAHVRALSKPSHSQAGSKDVSVRHRVTPAARDPDRRRSTRTAEAPWLDRGDRHKREFWQVQKDALKEKFGSSGWIPRKRLSPDALEGIRALHAQLPEKYTTPELAKQFEISPENIRRILKSKWKPNEEEDTSRRRRWEKRGESIWSLKAELGVKPPKKWRRKGIGKDQVAYHKREGHRFEQGVGTEESRSTSAAAISERRTKPSLSQMIL